jgi:hypothetical protein
LRESFGNLAIPQSFSPHPSSATSPLIAAEDLYVPVLVLPPFPKFGFRSLHAVTI